MKDTRKHPAPLPTGPDFVGVGVQKSGTSWLAEVLNQHPDLAIPKKEINFFVRFFRKGFDWYNSWFKCKNGKLVGEFTPVYFNSPRPESARREFYPKFNPRRTVLFWLKETSASDQLKKHYPDTKPFAIFRNPIDRAWSAYWFWRSRKDRLGKSAVEFERMWEDDGRWIRTTGLYGEHLSRWRKTFPDFGVFFYEDLKKDPILLAQSVYRFIGVDDTFAPETAAWINKGNYSSMPVETRKKLASYYREDLLLFSKLADRDVSEWLEIPRQGPA